mgnify:CR=1 FL=1
MRTHLPLRPVGLGLRPVGLGLRPVGLGLCLVGLAFAACKRPADIFELDPLDSAPMASCWSHGPLQLPCDACNGGDTAACLTVARNYEQRFDLTRRDRDARTAALFYGRACVQGYAPGCVVINDHYASIRGLDVPTRQVAAERRDNACTFVAAACDSGKDPFACRVQGLCLAEDWPQRKAPRDVNAAATAFSKACEQGDAQGCAELGFLRLREDGEGALSQAYAAHERGCKLESATSCVAAATQSQFGLGTSAAPGAAQSQLAEWCERGNPDACNAGRGYFASLRPLLAPNAAGQTLAPMPAAPINALELRPANVAGIARVGYCIGTDGRVERTELLDSTGAPALDEQILAHVKTWQLSRHPSVPVCAVHEQRVVFTFRSTGSRPFFTVWESWQTARGGTLLLDLDPLR